MSNKTYILMQEWISPFYTYPIGTEFEKENKPNGYYYPTTGNKFLMNESDIIDKPDWFKEKVEDKIEVNSVWLDEDLTNDYKKGWWAYKFNINRSIHPAQFFQIKSAIEGVLNAKEDTSIVE